MCSHSGGGRQPSSRASVSFLPVFRLDFFFFRGSYAAPVGWGARARRRLGVDSVRSPNPGSPPGIVADVEY